MMPSVNKKFHFFLFNLNAFNLGAFFQWLESSLINKETNKLVLKCMWKYKRPSFAKTIMNREEKAGVPILSSMKTSLKMASQ